MCFLQSQYKGAAFGRHHKGGRAAFGRAAPFVVSFVLALKKAHVSERASDRASERSSERVIDEASERPSERPSERQAIDERQSLLRLNKMLLLIFSCRSCLDIILRDFYVASFVNSCSELETLLLPLGISCSMESVSRFGRLLQSNAFPLPRVRRLASSGFATDGLGSFVARDRAGYAG